MKTIHINTIRPYDVHIGAGLMDQLADLLPPKVTKAGLRGAKAVLITDENVDSLYGERVSEKLETLGFQVMKAVVPAGETAKSGEAYLKLLSFMADRHVSRSDMIFALGGGVVGDLAGFLAATFLRGIDFVQLPTTLLAAVDSSVGGKTAINLPEGKNLVGAFYQPVGVIMDVRLLDTLSREIFIDGCAEVIKYGMIWDRALFDKLERHVLPDKRQDEELMTEIIARCVEIKEEVVSQDEREKGLRALLNFGHTIGHAVEKNSGFSISHGKAVAIGMIMATKAAEQAGICEKGVGQTLERILTAYGLPVTTDFPGRALGEAMLADKKIDGAKIHLILPKKIGECYIHDMKTAEMETFLLGAEGTDGDYAK
ncbi:MAG: 3-dehydroquinate synthase [Firmicutes bacterium]|nr:3-dehydroquinate synthase [Bacillota bacterium]